MPQERSFRSRELDARGVRQERFKGSKYCTQQKLRSRARLGCSLLRKLSWREFLLDSVRSSFRQLLPCCPLTPPDAWQAATHLPKCANLNPSAENSINVLYTAPLEALCKCSAATQKSPGLAPVFLSSASPSARTTLVLSAGQLSLQSTAVRAHPNKSYALVGRQGGPSGPAVKDQEGMWQEAARGQLLASALAPAGDSCAR